MEIDYMALFPHEGQMKFITVKGWDIYIAWDTVWLDKTVLKNPFSIYMYKRDRHIRVCSTLLYQFRKRRDLTEYINHMVEINQIENLAERLTEHSNQLRNIMKDKIDSEIPAFQAILREKKVTQEDFFYLQKQYSKLPIYLKRYLKEMSKS